ncbi:FAD/NAD(P)-binding domain-containing protein [Colletotrichum sublineola]|nr:FAD/NAD(P)-binding domain-containing protein [Colletotrichum sublineola]
MAANEAKRHQVVIVGGGITGLTLALMLQNLDVDYVLLEAYGTVTPNVGASIGLYANGLRILDQLGCYQDILTKSQPTEETICRNAASGKRIMTRHAKDAVIRRHGYATIFMERHDLLCVLYEHLRDKDRIILNKKVQRVETREGSAVVYTADGSIFEGQIVVGADGVRSTIRKEMWRNADDNGDSAAIPARDRGAIPCEHACVFGTAKPTPGIKPGDVISASGDGTVVGCMGGADGRVFVFWFWTLPASQRSCPIDDIPRFDDEDKRRELARGADAIIADNGLRFRAVVDNLKFSGVTALPHFVMRRWHYGRIIILGDAAHKFNPLVGQGGNSCIESCASLVNALRDRGLAGGGGASWALAQVTEASTAVERQRIDRVDKMVEESQDAMRASAWDTLKGRLMFKYIMPLMPMSLWLNFYSEHISGGLSLTGVGSLMRAHEWPYSDEKGAEEKGSVLTRSTVVTTLPIAALTAFFLARVLQKGDVLGGSFVFSRVMEQVSWFRR